MVEEPEQINSPCVWWVQLNARAAVIVGALLLDVWPVETEAGKTELIPKAQVEQVVEE